LDVIFEEKITEENDEFMVGHTSNYIKVKAKYDETKIGQEVPVLVTKATYPMAEGEII